MNDLIDGALHALVISKAEHLIIESAMVKYMRSGSMDDLSLLLNLLELHLEKEGRLGIQLGDEELVHLLREVKGLFVKGDADGGLFLSLARGFLKHDEELDRHIRKLDEEFKRELIETMNEYQRSNGDG